MEIKEFVENFAAQFDETDASVFTAETRFRDIDEWSLNHRYGRRGV